MSSNNLHLALEGSGAALMKQFNQNAAFLAEDKFKNTKSSISNDQIFFIRSRLNGQFLDVKNESKSDGSVVIIYPFNGNENQQWIYKNGNIVRLQRFGIICH